MGSLVIANNTSTKITKKAQSTNSLLTTTPAVTLLTTTINEYCDIYTLIASYVSGVTGIGGLIVEAQDNSTGYVYFSNTGAISLNNSAGVIQLKLLPNSSLIARVTANSGTFNFNISGIAVTNSP